MKNLKNLSLLTLLVALLLTACQLPAAKTPTPTQAPTPTPTPIPAPAVLPLCIPATEGMRVTLKGVSDGALWIDAQDHPLISLAGNRVITVLDNVRVGSAAQSEMEQYAGQEITLVGPVPGMKVTDLSKGYPAYYVIAGGKFLNEYLIAQGLAIVVEDQRQSCNDDLLKAQADAQLLFKGIWLDVK